MAQTLNVGSIEELQSMLSLLEGYSLPQTARQVIFTKAGNAGPDNEVYPEAVVANAVTPLDVIVRSLELEQERGESFANVITMPLVTKVCPTDFSGAQIGGFPADNVKLDGLIGSNYATSFDPGFKIPSGSIPPATSGHEALHVVVGYTPYGKKILQKRGIDLGDIVIVDINNFTHPKDGAKLRGLPPIGGDDGTNFIAVGVNRKYAHHVQEWTGRKTLTGSYTEGFVVGMAERTFLYNKAGHKFGGINEILLGGDTDAFACGKVAADEMGITNFKERFPDYKNPTVLVIGAAGHLGTIYTKVLQEFLPEGARIIIADTNKTGLDSTGDMLNISEKDRYHITDTNNPYHKDKLRQEFGIEEVDYVLHATGHNAVGPEDINYMAENIIKNEGAFLTVTHEGIEGVQAYTNATVQRGVRLLKSLSPRDQLGWAIDYIKAEQGFLTRDNNRFLAELVGPGGERGLDHPDITEVVSEAGRRVKQGSPFASFGFVLQPDYIARNLLAR